eukprot:IDg1568t1
MKSLTRIAATAIFFSHCPSSLKGARQPAARFTGTSNAMVASRTSRVHSSNVVRGCLQRRLIIASYRGKTVWSTKDIHDDHIKCYRAARCACGPASALAWNGVTRVPLRCYIVKKSIDHFGRC